MVGSKTTPISYTRPSIRNQDLKDIDLQRGLFCQKMDNPENLKRDFFQNSDELKENYICLCCIVIFSDQTENLPGICDPIIHIFTKTLIGSYSILIVTILLN
jgi:hypothetical protein